MNGKWIAVSACALGAGGSVIAGSDFQGGSWMDFSNAISPAGDNPIVNQSFRGGTSTTTFSTNSGVNGIVPNVLAFNGLNTFNAMSEVSFKIGDVSYFNGLTFNGDQSVDGALNVEFDVPSLANQAFNFFFGFTITPNLTGNPVLDGDILAFSFDGLAQVFTVDGVDYTLVLDGFDTDMDGIVDGVDLTLPENAVAFADVYATFTTSIPDPTAIPLPGAAGMALATMLPLAMRRRQRAC